MIVARLLIYGMVLYVLIGACVWVVRRLREGRGLT